METLIDPLQCLEPRQERLVHEKGGLLSINHDKPVIPWDYEIPAADC
ncbi:MAG: hypothetical protein RLP98_16255 [Devosia sp.]